MAEDVQQAGFTHVLLLGMGGSSLGPEVLRETFGPQARHPELLVLDSTDPAQIRTIESKIDPARTLFMVSSKSGTTLEPNILKQYFFERAKAAVGADEAGSRFIAVTDPGSKLQQVAERDQLPPCRIRQAQHRRALFGAVGFRHGAGRRDGARRREVARSAELMVRSCAARCAAGRKSRRGARRDPGRARESGPRQSHASSLRPAIADFGAWLEQLLAESTGKQGKGLIPVDAEPLGPPDVYGEDRVFVYMRLSREADAAQDDAVAALERAGHPVVRIAVADRYHIGQEFFRWEMATAVAGAILGINPFDQPDVEASKVKTRELTAAYEKTGKLPQETPLFEESGIKLFADAQERARHSAGADTLADISRRISSRCRPATTARCSPTSNATSAMRDALQDIRVLVRDRKRVATCLGFGPRFLHSTGQAYKGGPNTGVFLQITCDDASDLQVPGQKYTFGVVKAARGARRFRGTGRARPTRPARPSRHARCGRLGDAQGRHQSRRLRERDQHGDDNAAWHDWPRTHGRQHRAAADAQAATNASCSTRTRQPSRPSPAKA